jgi:lambda family phage minor tail protein L
MTLRADIQALAASGTIELFTLDATNLGASAMLHFCANMSQNAQIIVWQGISYMPLPIQATGFEWSGNGTLPRPKVTIANVDGMFGALSDQYNGLLSAKVIRKKTLTKFLDAVNFTDGINTTADPTQFFDDEIWIIDRKSGENNIFLEFELSCSFDLPGIMLPNRQFIQNVCPWHYRKSDCGYTGTNYFTSADVVTNDANKDVCGKRLLSCKNRFGLYATLPYGGFPGVGRV